MNIIKKEKEQEKQEKDNSFQPDEIMLIKFTTKTLYVPISDIDELVIDEIPGDAGTTQSDMVVLRVYTKKCHEGLSSREQAVQTLHTWTKWYNSHYRRYDVE